MPSRQKDMESIRRRFALVIDDRSVFRSDCAKVDS